MLKNAKNLLLIKMNKTKLKLKFGRIYFPLPIFSITAVASSSTRLYYTYHLVNAFFVSRENSHNQKKFG